MKIVRSDAGDSAIVSLPAWRLPFVVFICTLVALLEGFDIQALGIAAGKIMPLLHLKPAQAGIVFGGGMAGFVVGSSIGGWLSDHIGRRLLLSFSVVAFGAATLATAHVPDYQTLLMARIVTGLGLGAAVPNLIIIAHHVFSERWRTFVVSAMLAGMPLGGAIVSAFAAAYMETLGWRSLFYLGGFLPLALVPLILALPSTPRIGSGKTETRPAGEGLFRTLFGSGRFLTTLLLWTIFATTITVLYILLNWLPTLVTDLGLSSKVAALCSMNFNLACVVGVVIGGWAMGRFGFRWVTPLLYLGLIAAVFAFTQANSEAALLAASAAVGFFILGGTYGLYGVVPTFYPKLNRGFATGTSIGIGRIGSIIGPALGGILLGGADGQAQIGTIQLAMIIAATLGVLLLSVTARPVSE